MNWIKQGRVFIPQEHQLWRGCRDYAQSPQALEFKDHVRVYFSTRKEDKGKFLSHISYVDFSKNFKEIVEVSNEEVIALGKLGTFDEHGIFPISPVRVQDKIYAYTTGWSRRVSVSVETGVGLAISKDDGKTFAKHGDGPVLSNSLYEPMLVGDAFVRIYKGIFHMWYIFGERWLPQKTEGHARIYKIAHAISKDGIHWEKSGQKIIMDVLDENECQALPSVAFYNGKYHMVFCYRYATDFRTNPKRGYRLGYAWSDDLNTWHRDDAFIRMKDEPNSWDSDMKCYPSFIVIDNVLHLLYNGNQFGKEGFGLAILSA